MNLFTTICVTRLRQDSGKERHYQASYSPPAGYALFQHSRAKRITRSLKRKPLLLRLGSRLVPGTMGVWPGMERKKADCRSRWKTFKPRLLARGKQKRLGWRIPAPRRLHPGPYTVPGPGRARSGQGRRRPKCCLRPPFLRPVDEHKGSAGQGRSPLSAAGSAALYPASGRDPLQAPSFWRAAGVGSLEASLSPVSTR